MSTTRVRFDPRICLPCPRGRFDHARWTPPPRRRSPCNLQEDEQEAMQEHGRYARRVRRGWGLSQTELARASTCRARRFATGAGKALPDRRSARSRCGY